MQKVFAIERQMVEGYVNTLIANSVQSQNGGVVSADITFKEALAFHNAGFNNLGLPNDLWTRYIPSKVLSDAVLVGLNGGA